MSDKISVLTKQLYDSTPDNIIGVGYGYKTKQGNLTNEKSIIFYVETKKPVSELDPSEILPSTVNLDQDNFITDVQSVSIPQLVPNSNSNCYVAQDTSSDVHRETRQYLQGGLSASLYAFPYLYAGTLGAIVKDNEDGSLVALTNAHVALFNSDKSFINSQKDTGNVPDLATFNIEDEISSLFSQAGLLDLRGPAFGHVKRYAHLLNNGNDATNLNKNYVDAALVSIDSLSRLNPSFPDSYGTVLGFNGNQFLPNSYNLKIATTAEINQILNIPQSYQLAKSGRSTGMISTDNGCTFTVVASNLTVEVFYIDSNFNTSNSPKIVFEDAIEIAYTAQQNFTNPITGMQQTFNAPNIVYPGDSGSIVYANVNGIPKIIGLVFAGGNQNFNGLNYGPLQFNRGILCRIDKVCEILNVSALEDSDFNSPVINPSSNWTYITQSALTTANNPTIIVDNRKYWQVGLTNAGADAVYVTYIPEPEPTPSVTASVSASLTPSLTPSVSVSSSIGATPTPTPTPTLSVTPTNSASSICCIVGDFEFDLQCTPTPSPSQSFSPTPSISDSATPTPTPTPSLSLSNTPTPTPSPSLSNTPTPSESTTEPPTEAPYL